MNFNKYGDNHCWDCNKETIKLEDYFCKTKYCKGEISNICINCINKYKCFECKNIFCEICKSECENCNNLFCDDCKIEYFCIKCYYTVINKE